MRKWEPADYVLDLSAGPGAAVAEKVFDLVWRFDFTAPGFCVLDAGPRADSHTLRAWMAELKERLSEVSARRGRGPFAYRALARFDQQETTKFHLDGAPPQSLLVLGYEPSRVISRLLLADYTRAAFDLGITPQDYLRDHNPMYRPGEERLAPYATELPQPAEGHARIVFINNSSLPFTEGRTNALGVMHKAEIVTPNEAERRVINSMLLAATERPEPEDAASVRHFITTDAISAKLYAPERRE